MCGRYALSLPASQVRYQLQQYDLPSSSAPEDDEVRQTYNFAPGYHGLIYRADTPPHGSRAHQEDGEQANEATQDDQTPPPASSLSKPDYKIQAMKWGLIPFWTKRSPDYSSQLKTINCRDDSLLSNSGLWTSMKKTKRCIVIAQGFYEWLKKNNGKEKIPHFTKRKDGELMLMAGLWDCVHYEGAQEPIWSYTVITTSSNKQLKFLHDRMPVILDPGSEAMKTWLDPERTEWSKELQACLKPYEGELECYPVAKEVGKVGNNSPTFVVPIDSKDNKNNIANFFGGAKKNAKIGEDKKDIVKVEAEVMDKMEHKHSEVIKQDPSETRDTENESGTEDNAPLPVPPSQSFPPSQPSQESKGIKREHIDDEDDDPPMKSLKPSQVKIEDATPTKPAHKYRSATSNGSVKKSGATPGKKDGSQKITKFFGK